MYPSISAAAIMQHCSSAAAAAVRIDVVAHTGSTNADMLARLATAAPASAAAPQLTPMLLLALAQTAGRGRAGRRWESDDASLTFSLAWPFARPLAALVGLPLAVGVAVAEALAQHGAAVTLKWPNDVLQDGRKLAGILIETAGSAASQVPSEPVCWAVIGIGINIDRSSDIDSDMHDRAGAGDAATAISADDRAGTVPANAASAAAVPAAGTTAAAGLVIAALPATDRNRLMARLLDSLTVALQRFDAAGLAPFVARWNALHAHGGLAVDILDCGERLYTGTAQGIDAHGRLLLQTAQGVVAVLAGDVSLRLTSKADHAATD
jgi:BirA family biotin operon repressor/biotin-[acetyl-CoA-carboxylase] ligase